MPSHGTILDNGPVKLVKLDPSDPSYKDPKLWKGHTEATHALFKCSACLVVFCYADNQASKDRMAHEARKKHSTALVAVSSGDPQRPQSNQVVCQPSARQAPLPRTSDSTVPYHRAPTSPHQVRNLLIRVSPALGIRFLV